MTSRVTPVTSAVGSWNVKTMLTSLESVILRNRRVSVPLLYWIWFEDVVVIPSIAGILFQLEELLVGTVISVPLIFRDWKNRESIRPKLVIATV